MATIVVESGKGYPLEILQGDVDHKFQCSHCQLLLRDPLQSFCGHRFCRNCINSLISDGEQKVCPQCEAEGTVDEDTSLLNIEQTFPDNAIRRELWRLKVKCNNPGCTYEGTFKDYESSHLETCPFALMKCSRCGRHDIPRKMMEQHLAKCGKEGCIFGCEVEGDTEAHMRDNALQHVNMLGARVSNVESQISSGNQKAVEDMRKELSVIIPQMRTNLEQLGTKVTEVESGMASTGATGGVTGDVEVRLNEVHKKGLVLDKKLITFEGVTAVLNNQMEQILNRYQQLEAQFQREKEQRDALEKKVAQLERTITLKDVAIHELEMRAQMMELASFDGVLLWKITDFQRRRQEAVEGKVSSIYSQPFYTSHRGYKMCGRVYLNGDGMGKGSHISLFFVVMRGHYDPLLKWPFKQKVTMMIMDQNQHENIVDAFRPDPASSSFKQPTTDMNIASGCPLFMPLSMLDSKNHAYVKDDTIFIKIIVDLTDI